MMKLHNKFIRALHAQMPKRADLINEISDILKIEKESASRRLNGKVNFSIHEMGVLAEKLRISIDSLLYKDANFQWLPFSVSSSTNSFTINTLCDIIDHSLKQLKEINKKPTEYGNVCHTLPLEFFIYYPLLAKFMFFKWGYYFVGSKEFNKFSEWVVPHRLANLKERIAELHSYDHLFYIWDRSLIRSLAGEIENFYTMHVITTEEKDALKNEIKIMLTDLESFLKGKSSFGMLNAEANFYVSIISMGFTCYYFASEFQCLSVFQTFFSHSILQTDQVKEWIKGLRSFSMQFSGSGSIERRVFFEKQHNIMDQIL